MLETPVYLDKADPLETFDQVVCFSDTGGDNLESMTFLSSFLNFLARLAFKAVLKRLCVNAGRILVEFFDLRMRQYSGSARALSK